MRNEDKIALCPFYFLIKISNPKTLFLFMGNNIIIMVNDNSGGIFWESLKS